MPSKCSKQIDKDGKMTTCGKRADYRLPTLPDYKGKKEFFCKDHKEDGMYNTKGGRCKFGLCIIQPSFGYEPGPNQKPKKEYCSEHKLDGMVQLKKATKRQCSHSKSCKTEATWNTPKKNSKWFCGTHANRDTMICHKVKICEYQDCETIAIFNKSSEKRGKFCGSHKEPNMVNVAHRSCAHSKEPCFKHPFFNYPGEKKGLYCVTHKLNGMVNVDKRNKCIDEDCDNKYASFAYIGEKKPLYCDVHKKKGMINVTRNICIDPNCDASANYNFEGLRTRFCANHIKKGMIHREKRCEYAGCTKKPNYNLPGLPPRFCVTHITNKDMVHIYKKTCSNKKCGKSSHYNFYGNKQGVYCYEHKDKGMVDIKNRRCQEPGCSGDKNNINVPKIALYNFFGEKMAKFCKTHKLPKMTNVLQIQCKGDPECKIEGIYNYPGTTGGFCGIHKKENMILFPYRKCQDLECDEYATFGRNIRGEFCEEHVPNTIEYKSLLNSICTSCNLISVTNEKGFCYYCNPETVKTARLAKQKALVNWLKNSSEHNDYRSVDLLPDEIKECGDGYRPDILYELPDHYVILEVDENQHNTPQHRSCDIPRMINIQQMLALPTIFIRYNPDNYTDSQGRKTDADIGERRRILMKWLSDAKNNKSQEQLQVVYLFYNNFNISQTKYEIIDPMIEAKKQSIPQQPKLKISFKPKPKKLAISLKIKT